MNALRLFSLPIAAILCLLPWSGAATAPPQPMQTIVDEGIAQGVEDLISSMDVASWQKALDDAGMGVDIRKLITRFSKGDFSVNTQELVSALLMLLLRDVAGIVPAMSVILIVSVLSGVLLKLREATPGHTAAAAEYACYLMAAAPLVVGFSSMMDMGKEAVSAMVDFSQILFPTLLALLAALGGAAAGSVFQPAVTTGTHLLAVAVRDVLLWALMVCAALSVLNHLSPRLKLQGLSSLLMSAASWCMGVAFTVFLGVLIVQGVAASAFDGITLRTAKYAIDNFVPVVGGMFADTVDTLVSCSVVVKNAVGLSGLITLALLCLKPCVSILACMFVYRLCAAVLEPVADGRVVGALKDFCKVLTLLFVAVLSVGAMFFVMVTAMVSSGNAILSIR